MMQRNLTLQQKKSEFASCLTNLWCSRQMCKLEGRSKGSSVKCEKSEVFLCLKKKKKYLFLVVSYFLLFLIDLNVITEEIWNQTWNKQLLFKHKNTLFFCVFEVLFKCCTLVLQPNSELSSQYLNFLSYLGHIFEFFWRYLKEVWI